MGHQEDVSLRPPSRLLALAEGRAIFELGALRALRPFARQLPEGDGHGVLCLPGFLASDRSFGPMRDFLTKRNYKPYDWDQGRNLGLRDGLMEALLDRIKALADETGGKISLIGWSLGGIFARELAKRQSKDVRQVIALGSPFTGPATATHAYKLYERLAGHSPDNPPVKFDLEDVPPQPFTSVFTRTDGIVNWKTCLQKNSQKHSDWENIEVRASHCGIGVNPASFYIIADRLAQEDGNWAPFHFDGWRQIAFRQGSAETA